LLELKALFGFADAAQFHVPQAFTHGTLHCDDVERSRRFHVEVLGLESPPVSTPPNTSNIQRRRDISSSCNAARQYLSPVNRFTLQLGSAPEVEQAHREFVTVRQNSTRCPEARKHFAGS